MTELKNMRLKLILYSILAVLLAVLLVLCLINFCLNILNRTRNDSQNDSQLTSQLELELNEIEMRALNEKIEIIELYKKTLDKMNEEVVVIVNPDGRQLQLGTKIN
jgi:hypothetical protein